MKGLRFHLKDTKKRTKNNTGLSIRIEIRVAIMILEVLGSVYQKPPLLILFGLTIPIERWLTPIAGSDI